MSDSRAITPIRIRNIDFTVARQIEQCPKTMMLRELVMNAAEAAHRAPEGRRLVEIKGKAVPECGSARKLTIWNTGPGMTSEELDHICDLAASLGKDMALDGNFGMGAKVASLPSNTQGMRYRSCREGVVSQVILGQREGIYGKVLQPLDDGSMHEVIDVTDQVIEEGERPLDEDWTEVVLFGRRNEQDTVADPYDGDPEQDRQWITTYLYHRFYELPDGVEITMEEGTHPRDGRRPFKTIPQRADAFGRVETVDAGEGIRIHYLYDPPYHDTSHNKSISGSITTALSTCAIVYRGEMYDVRKSRKWASDAPIFGIPFGAKHISIHVELPNDFAVRLEPYRRFLQLVHGDQRQVTVEDFSELAFANRPEWLIEIINALAPKAATSTNDLKKQLQELLNELRVRTPSPRAQRDGDIMVDLGGARGAVAGRTSSAGGGGPRPANKPSELLHNPTGAKRANIARNMEQAPEITLLYDDEHIAEKEIVGKAARYFREANHLFVNMKYSAIAAAEDHLLRRYAGHEDPELVRSECHRWAEQIMMGRVGFAVVYAQAKQLLREWTGDDVKKALEPESLSLAADGWRDAISSAYHSISRRLGTSQAKMKEERDEDEAIGA